jgi:hypothetical protein
MRGGFYLDHYIRSSILPGIKGCLSDITINFLWLIGTGALVFFWKDNCLGYSLVDALHILPNEHRLLTTLVADSIIDVAMVIPPIITLPRIIEDILNYVFPTTKSINIGGGICHMCHLCHSSMDN